MCSPEFRNNSGLMPSSAACDHTKLRAVFADSCITSPNWPVMVRSLPFGSSVASMYRTSPPVSVHAKPVATPAGSSRRAISGVIGSGPSISATSSAFTVTEWPSRLRRRLQRDLANHASQRLLQPANASFPGVRRDDFQQRFLGDVALFRRQPGLRQLPGQQVFRRAI